ncbi:bifunctional [glutamate--ammonia ligase]-adenylyl-L-tyrosine phosphorylase/[glutamate--ammonia-ligase] adenylyltransferase [Polycyclovorans algicola]|uniref:bifunctional [glutamate--ammonia ligase]-adenylyl-L-tyrosine phosphorylase/[glutamate--ammonia-ligase] adenylyltransferase n=1 Tax=Polycyclovorans algicola TaxID=616992 RepID=UPI000693D651|nr:bifunctional [glutamate--ammonia ligase]-adenylyl-L-tyrosine phosphorylase/[glutamate--ammonia-ligase] adenylyltransferase [Polycyclovorans algicola]
MRPALQASPWLAEWAQLRPAWFTDDVLAAPELHWTQPPPEDEAAAMRYLRENVLRERMRLAVRDLEGLDDLDTTLAGLSDLAEQACELALTFAQQAVAAAHGWPLDAAGERIRPMILGMGKLGGRELNFSSDIDLIFTFSGHGETDGARTLDAGSFFAKVVQRFTRLLAERTEDGFVYRVDWMLRPFGSAGAAAASFAAIEDYYQVHGREWERYALIKARPIAGDLQSGRRLLTNLTPFVYRRYLDFDAINSLRELKRLIEDEVTRKGLEDHVKLGAGGIREVEFIVQSFQLVRGGQDTGLRSTQLRPTLALLAEQRLLEADRARQLDADYVFLRRLENAIQMQADEQTHRFPADPAARQRLAGPLGAADAATLAETTRAVRARVRALFTEVFAEDQVDDSPLMRLVGLVFDHRIEAEAAAEALHDAGLRPAEPLARDLLSLAADRHLTLLRASSVERLRCLVGQLLVEALKVDQPGITARRVLSIVAAITGRSTYISLLRDAPVARRQLLRLAAASPWLSEYLAGSPALLDQLLDPRTLLAPMTRDDIARELEDRLSTLPPEDPEGLNNALRRFQKDISLRVAAADLLEDLPLVQVSDRLTWLAECLLEVALDQVTRAMTAEFGRPVKADGSPAGLAVIGYGKLGGIEMGYGSDLDLVFIHDADEPQAETVDGRRTLDVSTWFARCAQRMINLLSTRTAAGRVYEVDLQLRPNGQSGLVVISLSGFARYQRESAWTWEHQALTRARFLCGPAGLAASFQAIRAETLAQPREQAELARAIVEMRQKMRASLDRSNDTEWDIKHGVGGLTDAEFITQYLVLREAANVPAVLQWSDNWRQLEVLSEAQVISADFKERLIAAYRELRDLAHGRALENVGTRVSRETATGPQAVIAQAWQATFNGVVNAS